MRQIQKNSFVAAMISMIGVLILTGCNALHIQADQQTSQPKEVQITEEGLACGSGVGLNVGDTLILILDGSPTTGYAWDVGFYVHTVIEPIGASEYQSDSNQAGAGGKYTFRFLATGEGEAKLMMIYHKPLDKNAPVFKTCEVTVIVK